MELLDIVKGQIAESDSSLAEARDRFHFVNGWNSACREILAKAEAPAGEAGKLELVKDNG
jgi:hypothetical protein